MSCLTSSELVIKFPAEVRNVSMDFTKALESGVTISSPVITVTPSDVTSSAGSVSDGIVVFTLSGGTAGHNYTVTVQVTTSDSQTLIGSGPLKVRD